MKITEYKSHFSAECDRCGHTVFFGRSELKEAFEKLVGKGTYLEFSLGCRCAVTAKAKQSADKLRKKLDLV